MNRSFLSVVLGLAIAGCSDPVDAPMQAEWHWVDTEVSLLDGTPLANPATVADSDVIRLRFLVRNEGGPDSMYLHLDPEPWPDHIVSGGVRLDSINRSLVYVETEAWFEIHVRVSGAWVLNPLPVGRGSWLPQDTPPHILGE